MAIQGARTDNGQIAAHLIVKDVAEAIDFYRRALGAEELYRGEMPGGRVLHAQLRIANSFVLVSLENMGMDEETASRFSRGMRVRSPHTLNGTSAILELYVDDVDAAFRRAIEAGAMVKLPVEDMFYGDRYGMIEDPFGHVWALATVKETLASRQIYERMLAHFSGPVMEKC